MSSIVAAYVDLRTYTPFVKWAGGKGQLLSELDKLIPSQFNNNLSDTNGELITAYTAVKDNVKEVIRVLQTYETEYKRYPSYSKEQQEYYFQLRNARNNIKSRSDVEIAALLIALNKTCFNGLYRVNRKGEFNVPPGKYKNPLICDSSNLENVSNVLAGATLLADDYSVF
jgi:DNA adenine methylase